MNLTDCIYCWRPYSQHRKPLMLKCGHTFCQNCIEFIYSQNFNFCPKDRMPNQCDISSLQVNRNLYNQVTHKHKICPTHCLPYESFHIKSAKFLCASCLKQCTYPETEIKNFSSLEEFLNTEYKNLYAQTLDLKSLYTNKLDYIKYANKLAKYFGIVLKYLDFIVNPSEPPDLESQISKIKKYDLFFYNDQNFKIESTIDHSETLFSLYVSDMQNTLSQNNYNQLNLWVSEDITVVINDEVRDKYYDEFTIKSQEEIWLEAIAIGNSYDYGIYLEKIYIYHSDLKHLAYYCDISCFHEKQPGSISLVIPIEPCIKLESKKKYALLILGEFTSLNYGVKICKKNNINSSRFQFEIITNSDKADYVYSRILYIKLRLK
ncbi:hypothetical protein SteCoe_38462 [Stentor coeruleus]|uniref:RING-type domain-containing protein n=1 Tax=Stentor coeruleus TaxID=5963 RepID=A0A1R2ALG1_9CILI|nr:hypothetical protein SteCoe_38462 [Stentor coeruleus]